MIWKDCIVVDLSEDVNLVVTCDSAGGLGVLPHDAVNVSPRQLGYHTAKVALFEMMSIKGNPFLLSNTLCVPMESTGKEIIRGIKDLLEEYHFPLNVELTGSTEENMTVTSTGIGITLLGRLDKKHWPPTVTVPEDVAVMIGEPLCGTDFLREADQKTVKVKHMQSLMCFSFIHEVAPGGSKGMAHEIKQIEALQSLVFSPKSNTSGVLHQSCGPSSAVLATLAEDKVSILEGAMGLPVKVLGKFSKKEVK